MKLDQYFYAPRFWQLLKVEGYLSYKRIFIIGSAVFAFLLFLSLVNGADRDFRDFHEVFFPLILLAGGFFFTSREFNELNTKEGRMNYLSLPASTIEKLSAKWFISTIFYMIAVTAIYWIFALITDVICQHNWNFKFDTFQPFSNEYSLFFKLYIVLQSIFLVGAITFNKYAFFKTILAVFVIGIALILFLFLAARITFSELFDGFFTPMRNQPPIRPNDSLQEFVTGPLWTFIQYFFWLALAPVLWVVSYFKLKEREV